MKLQLAQIGLGSGAAATDLERQSGSPVAGGPREDSRASAGPPAGSIEFRRRMAAVAESLRSQEVGAILLVDSSFAAVDARDFFLALARRWPAGSSMIRQLAARLIDDRSHDAGGYTPRFAELLEQTLSRHSETIPVRIVHWSGERHHLGRADAAVRLIDELAGWEMPPEQRIMLWGQGQAGNVLALMLGLLSADAATRDRFFAAAQVYYRLPATGVVDVPVWHRVRQLLTRHPDRLAPGGLDVVTFGTPLRYACHRRAADRVLHVINHRPAVGTARHLARLPMRLDDLMEASGGDYVQQLAVAGTDTPPSRFAWRSWLADRRLGDLLDLPDGCSTVAERLERGTRATETGATLLVDYGPPTGAVSEHLAGHAVYTRREWLLFHAEQVAQRLGSQDLLSARAA